MKTVLSGVQPSGNLHLGNYLGAIRNWIGLQDQHNCLFGIMNLHAITVPQDPQSLRQNVFDAAAIYLACGLDPARSAIFVQSDITEHAELAWVLGCLTPLGWLNRMTQFKEKSATNEALGLYAYPALMAADILLYNADLVPVGEDQKQHLELTRDLAGAFNRRYNIDYFKLPEPLTIKGVKRIMSLQDGAKKMSKSDESELSRINITDSSDEIVKKIKKAKTDSFSEISYDETRLEIYNLLNIFAAITDKDPQDIAAQYKTAGYGKFKADLAEIVVAKLAPMQDNLRRIKQDRAFVLDVLRQGREKANAIASKTKKEVFSLVGLN